MIPIVDQSSDSPSFEERSRRRSEFGETGLTPMFDEPEEIAIPELELDETAGLADWLCAARETAEAVKSADHRSRAALYRALSQAYDFALVAASTIRRNMPSCSRNRA